MEILGIVLGVVSLGATIWFGIRPMSKKKKIAQKQAQRGDSVKVQSQKVGEQRQDQRGPGVQVQTLEIEEE